MTAGNATADYPSSALANRKQIGKECWRDGSTLKRRNAPKAFGHVPEEGQPRGFTVKMLWTVVLGEYASDHIFIDVESECFVDLLRDSWATKSGITSFKFNNDPNKIIRGIFRTRLSVFL